MTSRPSWPNSSPRHSAPSSNSSPSPRCSSSARSSSTCSSIVLFPIGGGTNTILLQVEDDLALLEQRGLGELFELGALCLGEELGQDGLDVIVDLVEGKGKELLFGFEVDQLEQEVKLGMHEAEDREALLLWLRER